MQIVLDIGIKRKAKPSAESQVLCSTGSWKVRLLSVFMCLCCGLSIVCSSKWDNIPLCCGPTLMGTAWQHTCRAFSTNIVGKVTSEARFGFNLEWKSPWVGP